MDGDIFYKRKSIKSKDGVLTTVFAEALVEGKASLYEINEEFYLERDSLMKIEQGERLVSLPGAPPEWVKTNKFIGITRALTNDCPPANLDFNKLKYKPKDFVQVAEGYNECLHSEHHTYKQDLASNKTTFRILGGINSARVSFKSLPKHIFKNSQSFFGGAGLEFSSPKLSWKSAFILELWLSKVSVEGTYSHPFSTFTRHDTYQIDVTIIRLPVGIKHFLGRNTYIKGGPAFMAMRNNDSKIKEVFETSASSVTYYEKFNKISNGQLAIWGGLGVQKKIGTRNKIMAEVQYEQGTGLVRRTQFDNNYGNAVFLIGLSF
jgi:hypothetical protein